jgi:hypothetical protein
MRVQLFWSYYDGYLDRFYAARPGLSDRPHREQIDTIAADRFGWMPAVVDGLRELGHETDLIVVNARHAQRAWAREHGATFDEGTWTTAIPREQVRRFEPDVLLIGSMFTYYGEYLRGLRQYARRIAAWNGVPTPPGTDVRGIDLVITSHVNFQRDLRARGLACERLLPAFDPRVLDDLKPIGPPDVAASFVGSLTWAHRSRIELLRRIGARLPIDLYVTFPKVTLRSLARPRLVPAWLASRPLIARSRGSVFGLDMYRVLARSKLSVNVHLEAAQGLAGNMRMFEATGVGSVLLTEEASNMAELFEPGTEVVTYRNADDLVARMQSLLEHEDERARIAAAGQRRTLRDHAAPVRARQLAEILR